MKPRLANQFKRYRWRGITAQGKRVSGHTLALNAAEVSDKLSQRAIQLQKIRPKPLALTTRLTQTINNQDVTLLTQQMATMLASGIPLVAALKLIGQNHRKAEMRSVLIHVSKAVESGAPLSQALASANRLFDGWYIDLLASGELSGHLAETLQRLATYREKSQQLKTKVMTALIYPAMVLFTAVSVAYLMLTLVIPQFEAMFSGFAAALPWLTQQVLALSAWLQAYTKIGLIILSCIGLLIKVILAKSYPAQLRLSRLMVATPLLGALITKATLAKFSRTLATSLNAGVPILTALKASAKTAHNLHYQGAIDSALADTTAGMPLYLALRNSAAFPEVMLQMVMIGEESGRLDQMLDKIADLYEAEIDSKVDKLGKIIEPALIIFLGVTIGTLVIAMYLPIFNLMNVLG